MSYEPPLIIVAGPASEAPNREAALIARGFEVAGVTSAAQLHRLLDYTLRALVVLDDALPLDAAWGMYDLLSQRPGTPVLALVDAPAYQRLCLDASRRTGEEYAPKPVQSDELVLRVCALVARSGLSLPPEPAPSAHGHGTPVAESEAGGEPVPGGPRGDLTAVFSLKGGVGKSTLATNLAVSLAATFKQKALLVDGDLMAGQVGVLLNRDERLGILNLCVQGTLDAQSLTSVLTSHPSGLDLLLRPPEMVHVEQLDNHVLLQALPLYARLYQHVVVDLGPSLSELNLEILDLADRVLLVTTPDLPSLATTKRVLSIAGRVGWDDKLQVVLNGAGNGLELADVQETLGRPVSAQVAYDEEWVVRAANHGQALVELDPRQRRRATRELTEIAASFVREPGALAAPRVSAAAKARGLPRLPRLPGFRRAESESVARVA